MSTFWALFLCAVVASLAACSPAAFYEDMRLKQQNISYPEPQPLEPNSFKAQALPSYETYQKELKKFDPQAN